MVAKQPVRATPPLSEIADRWAQRAKTAWEGGQVDKAIVAARKAVDAHERFGSKAAVEPQAIAACRRLIEIVRRGTP
jgi:hypothetical protein